MSSINQYDIYSCSTVIGLDTYSWSFLIVVYVCHAISKQKRNDKDSITICVVILIT